MIFWLMKETRNAEQMASPGEIIGKPRETENVWLRRARSDPPLDKLILQEAAPATF